MSTKPAKVDGTGPRAVQLGPVLVEANARSMNQTRLFSDYRFPLSRFLLTYRNECVTIIVRFRFTPRRVHRRSHTRKIAPLTPLFLTLMKGAPVSPLSTARTSTPGSTPFKSETRRSHSAGRHGVVLRRRYLLSVLDFALPGFGIPDPVDVTASRNTPLRLAAVFAISHLKNVVAGSS